MAEESNICDTDDQHLDAGVEMGQQCTAAKEESMHEDAYERCNSDEAASGGDMQENGNEKCNQEDGEGCTEEEGAQKCEAMDVSEVVEHESESGTNKVKECKESVGEEEVREGEGGSEDEKDGEENDVDLQEVNNINSDKSETPSQVNVKLQAEEACRRKTKGKKKVSKREKMEDDDGDDENRDDDDVDDEEDEEVDDKDDKDDTEIEDNLLKKPYPKPSWHPVIAHWKRQMGEYKTPWAFSHDAIGSYRLVERFKQYAELDSHDGCVNTLHFNQAGDRLASGSDDLKIAVWDWVKQEPVLVYDSGHKRNVFQAKFMPNSGDTTLVSCARDGQVRVGALSSTGVCKETKRVAQHKQPAHKLGLEPDSPVVFMSCGEDAVVWNVDLREPKPQKVLAVKEEEKRIALYTIQINPSKKEEFVVGGRDHLVRIYDRRKLRDEESFSPVKKYCPHHLNKSDPGVNVTCSVYSYDGQEILVSYNDDDIYLFDNTHSDGADFIHRYQGHRNNATVKGVNFYGARSEFVVSGSDCGNIFLWSKETERIVQLMHGDDGGVVNCLEPHPSAPILATSGLDHDIKIWMPTAQEPANIEKHKKTLQNNRLEREEERHREPSHLESQMFRFLLQHLRRSTRRQAREAGDDLDSDDSSSTDSDDEEEDDFAQQMACSPS